MNEDLKRYLQKLNWDEKKIQELDDFTNSMAEGAAPMGTVANVAGKSVKAAFPSIQKMFQVGDKTFPAGSTAEALKIKEALEKMGKTTGVLRKLD